MNQQPPPDSRLRQRVIAALGCAGLTTCAGDPPPPRPAVDTVLVNDAAPAEPSVDAGQASSAGPTAPCSAAACAPRDAATPTVSALDAATRGDAAQADAQTVGDPTRWSCATAAGICHCAEVSAIVAPSHCDQSSCCLASSDPNTCSCLVGDLGLSCAAFTTLVGGLPVTHCP